MTSPSKRVYEALFLVDSAVATANWDIILDAIQTVMSRGEAEVVSLRKWDERRLMYEVAGRKRGTYIICYFKVDPQKIAGIERDVKLNEFLLRVMILRAEHMTEEEMSAPTPAMQKESSETDGGEDATDESSTAADESRGGTDESSHHGEEGSGGEAGADYAGRTEAATQEQDERSE